MEKGLKILAMIALIAFIAGCINGITLDIIYTG